MKDKKIDYTKIIAIYGAVVSSVALIWAIGSDVWKEVRSEGKLKVSIIGYKYNDDGNETFDMKFRVVNEGRRTIVLTEWGIAKIEKNGSSESTTFGPEYNLPVTLEEKQLYTFNFKTKGLPYADHHLMANATEIFFIDSVGNKTVVYPDEIEWWESSGWISTGAKPSE